MGLSLHAILASAPDPLTQECPTVIEAEVIFLVKESAQELYYRRIVEDLSHSFSLPITIKDLRPVRVIDRYFDTPSLRFLAKQISLRVRERRFVTGPESEGRFTLKTPPMPLSVVSGMISRPPGRRLSSQMDRGCVAPALTSTASVRPLTYSPPSP